MTSSLAETRSDVDPASGLTVAGVTVTFPDADAPALDDVSIAVQAGRIMAVIGPSGCGKSTLLRAVAGLQPIDGGRIAFSDHDLHGVPTHRRDFALMFQDGQLFGHLNVEQNVAYGLQRRGISKKSALPRVHELLELVGMSGFEKRSVATLSGGQQQRVALARALAPRPRLLLLDEPLSALDRSMRERLATDLREVLTAEKATAMFVTHDFSEALTIADDLAVMRHGRVASSGTVSDVWRHPADRETAEFLGYTNTLNAPWASHFGLRAGTWAIRPDGLIATAVPDAGGAGDGVRGRVVRVAMTPLGQSVRVRVEASGEANSSAIAGVEVDCIEVDCVADASQALANGEWVDVHVREGAGVRFE